jgi:hypothetical protein
VSKHVFGAFQLAWPFSANAPVVQVPTQRPQPATGPVVDREVQTLPVETASPVTPHDEHIESWAIGGQLIQQPANEIRKIIAHALNERLDWNSLRMRRQTVQPGHIWLPFARVGNPTAEPRFVVGPEARPLTFNVRAGVLALCRWAANGRSWNYPRSEDDYAVAQMLLDGMEAQAMQSFPKMARQRAQAALRTLHRQALLLRMTRKAEPDEPALVDYFRPLDAPPVAPDNDDRSHEGSILQVAVAATDALDEVREALLGAVACFQGPGTTALGVDRVRLQAAWNADNDDSQDSAVLAQSEKARQIARDLGSNRLKTLVSRYTGVLEKRLPIIQRVVGPNPEVSLVVPIKELLSEAKRSGTLASVDYSPTAVERALAFLASDVARSVLRHASSFSAPDAARSAEFQLAACTEIELASLRTTTEALETLEALVTRIQRAADSQLKASGGGDVADALNSLRTSLTALAEEGESP